MELTENILQELKDNTISIEELNKKYFIDSQGRIEDENILKLLYEDICSFKEIIDKFKSIYALDSLLYNEKLFRKLIQNNKVSKNDLKHLLNRTGDWYDLDDLSTNTILLKHIVDKNIVSLKELIDKFKSVYELNLLLDNKKLFEELIRSNRLSKDDLKYLLNKIDAYSELNDLCNNTSLLKDILNEFVLNKEDVDRFTIITDKHWRKIRNIPTIFELVEYRNQDNKEVLKLTELNKKVYSFDLNEDQRLELIELIQNNEIAKNRLIEIVETHLESNYDFDSLLNYLKKKEKKNLINI